MKNSTNFLVAIGSVATLGLATLPLHDISAAPGQASVSGNVQLNVQVLPAISMTITGTHDDDPGCGVVNKYNDASGNTTGVVDTFVGTPGGANEVNNNTSCSKITMLPNTYDTTTSKVKVYTNNTAGYELSVAAAESTDLTHTGNGNYTIPAGTLTSETGGQGTWSYKTDGEVTEWSRMKASDTVIRTRSTKTSGGEETNITYGVSTTSDQASGTYMTTLVYTATTLDDGEAPAGLFDSCGTAVGSVCEVQGVTYKRQVDGNLWSTTAAGGESLDESDLVCPAETHLPTGAEYYDLLMEYGAVTDGGNTWPYGISLSGANVSQLVNDTGWAVSGFDFFASSTPASDGHNWTLAFFGSDYVAIDNAGGMGALPLKGVCVAD